MNTERDKVFMRIALDRAIESYSRGDLPIGAALIINDKLVGVENNKNETNEDWNSHAEVLLIRKYSKLIKKSKKENAKIGIYTTLEPCLMCLGTMFFNRIGRIVYACPDPNGGVAKLNVQNLPEGYAREWPNIEQDNLFAEESYNLLVSYMERNQNWKEVLTSFRTKVSLQNK